VTNLLEEYDRTIDERRQGELVQQATDIMAEDVPPSRCISGRRSTRSPKAYGAEVNRLAWLAFNIESGTRSDERRFRGGNGARTGPACSRTRPRGCPGGALGLLAYVVRKVASASSYSCWRAPDLLRSQSAGDPLTYRQNSGESEDLERFTALYGLDKPPGSNTSSGSRTLWGDMGRSLAEHLGQLYRGTLGLADGVADGDFCLVTIMIAVPFGVYGTQEVLGSGQCWHVPLFVGFSMPILLAPLSPISPRGLSDFVGGVRIFFTPLDAPTAASWTCCSTWRSRRSLSVISACGKYWSAAAS